jgi:hypothetical protein
MEITGCCGDAAFSAMEPLSGPLQQEIGNVTS